MIVNRSYAHKCIVQHEAQPYSSHQPISFPIAPQSAIAEHLVFTQNDKRIKVHVAAFHV